MQPLHETTIVSPLTIFGDSSLSMTPGTLYRGIVAKDEYKGQSSLKSSIQLCSFGSAEFKEKPFENCASLFPEDLQKVLISGSVGKSVYWSGLVQISPTWDEANDTSPDFAGYYCSKCFKDECACPDSGVIPGLSPYTLCHLEGVSADISILVKPRVVETLLNDRGTSFASAFLSDTITIESGFFAYLFLENYLFLGKQLAQELINRMNMTVFAFVSFYKKTSDDFLPTMYKAVPLRSSA